MALKWNLLTTTNLIATFRCHNKIITEKKKNDIYYYKIKVTFQVTGNMDVSCAQVRKNTDHQTT